MSDNEPTIFDLINALKECPGDKNECHRHRECPFRIYLDCMWTMQTDAADVISELLRRVMASGSIVKEEKNDH